MADIISTDLPHLPRRRLQKKFTSGAAAMGMTAPNTLGGGANIAMGVTPNSGIFNFYHDGASQNVTISYWASERHAVDATKGWITGGEGASIHTKTVDPEGNASFKCPPNVPYFMHCGTSDIDNVWVHDAGPLNTNQNTDKTHDA